MSIPFLYRYTGLLSINKILTPHNLPKIKKRSEINQIDLLLRQY